MEWPSPGIPWILPSQWIWICKPSSLTSEATSTLRFALKTETERERELFHELQEARFCQRSKKRTPIRDHFNFISQGKLCSCFCCKSSSFTAWQYRSVRGRRAKVDAVYYNNLIALSGAVSHSGDEVTGQASALLSGSTMGWDLTSSGTF